MIKLDRKYAGDWVRDYGGKIKILEGFRMLSNHLLVLTIIRKWNKLNEFPRQFKFNLSFLKEETLKQILIEIWNLLNAQARSRRSRFQNG